MAARLRANERVAEGATSSISEAVGLSVPAKGEAA
jgi:hypothetical protein